MVPVQHGGTRAAAATLPWCPCRRAMILPEHGEDGARVAGPHFFFLCIESPAGATQGDFTAFPLWGGGILAWKHVLAVSGNLSCFLSPSWICRTSVLTPAPVSHSLYLPLCVHLRNLPFFCRSPCSGPVSVLQVGMTAAYQVGGFGLCVEFGEWFCSKLLYFLACKPWEHMAHCLQNADILKLGEE